MNARKLALSALLLLVLALGLVSTPRAYAQNPTPVPTTAGATAFDLKAVLDKYFTALPDGFGGIAPDKLKEQMDVAKPFLVDIREAKEVADNGFIEGSINIPSRTLIKNLDKLPAKDQAIVVICGSGHRSALGMEALQLLGYTNVKSMSGGFTAWKNAKLPVATGTPTAPVAGKAPEADKNLVAALDKYFSALPDGYYGIAPDKLKEQMSVAKPFILDVRETKEVTDNGYVEGSVNIPVRTLIKNLDKLPAKDQPIVVMCASGHRSAISMEALQLLGYTNVKSLSGGFTAWKNANLPILTAAPAAAADLQTVLDKYVSGLPDGFNGIAPDKLKEQMGVTKLFILDVRETKEVADNGYVEGSVNIPIRTLTKNLSKLPAKDQPIVVMCASGHRSAIALTVLQLLGYTNVKSLSGGFTAWKNANLPIVTTPK